MHGFLENWSVEDLDHVGDAYYGHYDSFRDFAENHAHETIEGLDGDSTLARYFDYEAWERDLSYDFHEAEGENGQSIIFNCNW